MRRAVCQCRIDTAHHMTGRSPKADSNSGAKICPNSAESLMNTSFDRDTTDDDDDDEEKLRSLVNLSSSYSPRHFFSLPAGQMANTTGANESASGTCATRIKKATMQIH